MLKALYGLITDLKFTPFVKSINVLYWCSSGQPNSFEFYD